MAHSSPAPGTPLVVRPAAKVNLTLEVLGRRPDGYHDLLSVFQAIDLRDTLRIAPSADLALECDRPDLAGEGNLALKAARLLREAAGVEVGARIRLEKGIPVAAGLGGGSADAAGVLVGLARLWGLDWPRARLRELAAHLGSDVPFFLGPATALASGRGERLSPLPALPPHWALVVRPTLAAAPPADKTRRLYAALTPEDYGSGEATRAVADCVAAGRPLDPAQLVNSFARAARAVFPEIARTEEQMLEAGARWVRLAGSGPCLFTLCPIGEPAQDQPARTVAERLRSEGCETYLVRTLADGAIDLDAAG